MPAVRDIRLNRAGQLTAPQGFVLGSAVLHGGKIAALGALAVFCLATTTAIAYLASRAVILRSDSIAFTVPKVLPCLALTVLAVRLFLRRVRLRNSVRADLKRQQVTSVAGRILWRQGWFDGDYVAEATDGSGPVRAEVAPLAPGPYRFYLLPESRVAVAAESTAVPGGLWTVALHSAPDVAASLFGAFENSAAAHPIGSPPTVGDPAELLRALAAALHFNAEDLAHNRRGTLSAKQQWRILRNTCAPLFLALPLLAVPAFFMVQAWHAGGDSSMRIVWLVIPALLAFVAIALYIRHVVARKVDTIDGTFQRRVEISQYTDDNNNTRTRLIHYISIQGRQFRVSHVAWRAALPSLRYRVYFSRSTGRLLSLDPLDLIPAQHPGPPAQAPAAPWMRR